MPELPRQSYSGPTVKRVVAESVLSALKIEAPENVIVCAGNPDWLVSVASSGRQDLVAICAYRHHALGVGRALALALDCRLDVIT